MTSKKHMKQYASFAEGCFLCGERDYRLLDCHRIVPGSEGGTYHPLNTVILCPTCHRKTHTGLVRIIAKRASSGKKPWVIEYEEDGVTKWR